MLPPTNWTRSLVLYLTHEFRQDHELNSLNFSINSECLFGSLWSSFSHGQVTMKNDVWGENFTYYLHQQLLIFIISRYINLFSYGWRLWNPLMQIISTCDWFPSIGKTIECVVNSSLLSLHLVNCLHATLLLTVGDLFIQSLVYETLSNELFNGWVKSHFIGGSCLLLFVLLVCVFFRSIWNVKNDIALWIFLAWLIQV